MTSKIVVLVIEREVVMFKELRNSKVVCGSLWKVVTLESNGTVGVKDTRNSRGRVDG